MIARNNRADRVVSRTHRTILRTLHIQLLEEAYSQLLGGYSEGFVCKTLGIDEELMDGALRSAIEEALWERGYFSKAGAPTRA
jgi:hypothetical protein